jgi:hypothetical protein
MRMARLVELNQKASACVCLPTRHVWPMSGMFLSLPSNEQQALAILEGIWNVRHLVARIRPLLDGEQRMESEIARLWNCHIMAR